MGLLDDIRGLLTPKPAVVPNPFDRQANAAIPIMGASEILPNMVGRMTGSPMAEFAAGFLSPSSWIKQPKKLDIFVGKKGIKNLGLDDVLEKARQMEKAGKSRDEIWEATAQMAANKGVPGGGIGRGVDKQWRFEISDKYDIIDSPQGAKEIGAHWKSGKDKHLSSLYEGGSPSITQHMAMSHDDLFKAYPELRATNLTGGADKSRGSFSGDTVTMRWDDIARASNPQKVEDLREPMSTNLHELQHAIQQREGFARGGNPKDAWDFLQEENGRLATLRSIGNSAERYAAAKELEKYSDLLKSKDKYDAYRRLAGEAEARLTQSRMNMTPLDRQMLPPWSQKELGGYDVPESQQIVRFGDGPAMAINPSEYGLPVNPDGTVSLLHGTTKDAANKIIGENRLRSAGEPSVYLTNANDAGYGDGTLVQVDVDPRKLFLDDEFPGGRFDFSMPVRGGVANVKNARMYGDGPQSLLKQNTLLGY